MPQPAWRRIRSTEYPLSLKCRPTRTATLLISLPHLASLPAPQESPECPPHRIPPRPSPTRIRFITVTFPHPYTPFPLIAPPPTSLLFASRAWATALIHPTSLPHPQSPPSPPPPPTKAPSPSPPSRTWITTWPPMSHRATTTTTPTPPQRMSPSATRTATSTPVPSPSPHTPWTARNSTSSPSRPPSPSISPSRWAIRGPPRRRNSSRYIRRYSTSSGQSIALQSMPPRPPSQHPRIHSQGPPLVAPSRSSTRSTSPILCIRSPLPGITPVPNSSRQATRFGKASALNRKMMSPSLTCTLNQLTSPAQAAALGLFAPSWSQVRLSSPHDSL